jgi:hypothetical protein
MNIGFGLENGVTMGLWEMYNRTMKSETVTGQAENKEIFLPGIDLISTDTNLPFTMKRKQFPICLAFLITINKSHGQTFNKLGIYLPYLLEYKTKIFS